MAHKVLLIVHLRAIRPILAVVLAEMDAPQAQEIVHRDQLWASLRVLRPEIERLAENSVPLSIPQLNLSVLLARIVLAELDFRTQEEVLL